MDMSTLCNTCCSRESCPEVASDVRLCVEYQPPTSAAAREAQLLAAAQMREKTETAFQELCRLIELEARLAE
jgi:hypothetical protein